MRAEELVARHPRLFHVASEACWPSIQRHGLLSTSALLDLHGVPPDLRVDLLRRVRRHSTVLDNADVGVAVVRDQKPLKFIEERIESGSTLDQFLEALSSRVFFAPTEERLRRLVEAREYRGTAQVVLTVDTGRLLERYESDIRLCRFNSGACTHRNHPFRSHRSWLPISDYPYDEYRRRHGVPLVEVTVPGAVPDILDVVTRVEHITPTGLREQA